MEFKLYLKRELMDGGYILALMFLVWSIMIYLGLLPREWLSLYNIMGAIAAYFAVRLLIYIIAKPSLS